MECGDPPAPPRLRSFHELMQSRVQRILLVSSLYDSFILSEEGHLQETLLGQFLALNLTNFPDVLQVSTAAEAVELMERDRRFDLVIASVGGGDADAADLACTLRDAGHTTPVLGLAYTGAELRAFLARDRLRDLERVFLWQGDVRILLAMVKYLEDRLNVERDTGLGGVPAILVVEDSIRFYSSFLPTIYSELYQHTSRLLSEDLNVSQKMMRMRTRPKVLLCDTYEEAWDVFVRFQDNVLGVISDFEFPRGGQLAQHAGRELCDEVRRLRPDARLVLQSSDAANESLAREIGASFLQKGSPVLLRQLQEVLVDRFGFGDFVFRDPGGAEVARADTVAALGERLRTVPAASLAYHAARDDFANWLKARAEFALAARLRPCRVEDFDSVEELRASLLQSVEAARLERNRSVIADFDRSRFEPSVSFTRIGAGSLGGKARGAAFANRLLRDSGLDTRFPGVDVYVPPSVVIGTQVFEEFLEYPRIRDFAIGSERDDEIVRRFLEAPFPRHAVADLWAFLQRVKYPLAVRSSSLLEDSLSQPFAGVYRTYMLPNNDPDLEVRWKQLAAAIKRVYASTFAQQAKGYLSMTSYRLEEEQMAVMVQELVGRQHGDRFYPDFSGVARSWSFYPEPGHRPEEGVVAVALGMGKTVVDGSPCLRFCPRHPRHLVGFSSVRDALDGSQREFYGVDLDREAQARGLVDMRRYPLEVAEQDGTLTWLGSTYSADNNVIVDGISRPGVRLVSFAQVLKHGAFPLAELLSELLEHCSRATGAPIEIEFAGNLGLGGGRPRFGLLQMRPLALSSESEAVELGDVPAERVLCRASRVLGNGAIRDLADLVVVDMQTFERGKSREVALEVARFDAILRREGRPYLLIGVGRWGSSDPLLGIPVGWNQIAGARVIVEAGLRDLKVAPSQGTHFFQNLTSGSVGYFTVNPELGEGELDWDWLAAQPAEEEAGCVRRLRLEQPLEVKMDGRAGEGVVLKPAR
ncbi:MAG: PEP/pyruvate-binding domain-containing protein [Planctomycetota bacterium]